MGTVTVRTFTLGSIIPINGVLHINCLMNKQQISASIESMLHNITDAEWSDIIEELTPDLLDEMVEEKIQQRRR